MTKDEEKIDQSRLDAMTARMMSIEPSPSTHPDPPGNDNKKEDQA